MKPVEKQMIDKVSAVLDHLGMEWAIKDSDGVVHGTLKVEPPKKKGVEVTRFDAQTAKFLKSDPLADLLNSW